MTSKTSPNATNGKNGNKKNGQNGHNLPVMPASDIVPGAILSLDGLLARVSERLVTLEAVNLAPAQHEEPIDTVQYLLFRLGETYYGIELSFVGEVVTQPRITRVPGLPQWILGITNLHGSIISVVDLRQFLSLPGSNGHKGVMFLAHAEDQQIGLVVDTVESIHTFPAAQIFSPPFRIESALVAYLRGAVDREGHLIRLLDCERLLLGSQMQQFA